MKKGLLVFFLFVASFMTRAQVTEYDLRADSNSIVRTVNDSCVLIYVHDSSWGSHFMLCNEVTGQRLAFQMPANVMVHDFRIYDGWEAYFCGTSGGMAVVGMFRIPSVFFLGGGIRMWTIPLPVYYPNYQYISGLVWLRDLTRLSLYEVGGQVCMAMVGEAIFDPVSQIPKTVVVSSYFDGAQWNLYVDASKPYNFIRFTDIECLDDVIVAVGTDVNNSGCYMKTYKKMLDFPGIPCTAGAGFRIPFKNPVGEALVAKYLGNEAAIAHYDASGSTVMHRVAFDATGAIPTMTAATWQSSPSSVYGYSADWKMFEMATATSLEYSSVLVERVLMYDGSYYAYGPGNYLPVVVFEVAGEVICE